MLKMKIYNPILKHNLKNIKNKYIDLYYEILLSANKDYHLARRILSKIS